MRKQHINICEVQVKQHMAEINSTRAPISEKKKGLTSVISAFTIRTRKRRLNEPSVSRRKGIIKTRNQ